MSNLVAKPNFTIPKIVKYDDLKKPWFVYFRYNNILCRYKRGINNFKTYSERLSEANALCDSLKKNLKAGWNPLISEETQIFNEVSNLTIIEALNFSLEKKKNKLAPISYLNYSGTLRFCIRAVKKLKINNIKISDVEKFHVKLILDHVTKERNWSNKAFNKHLGYLKSLFSELIEWDILKFSPATGIKSLRVEQTISNTPATEEEQKKIKEFLSKNHPNFYNFVVLIYHTGIRPVEALQIKLFMIDVENQEIILPAEITKTSKDRIVPINKHLKKVFESMNIINFPKDYYVFGSFKPRGGKGNDFIPGPYKMKRDTATKRWKSLIKDELGITNVNLYSNKHKGANDKILSGISLDALMELYGHSSKLMTEKYAKIVKAVYRKQILDNSPDF